MRVMMTWAANFTAPEINEYKTREQHWRLISDAEAAGRGYRGSFTRHGFGVVRRGYVRFREQHYQRRLRDPVLTTPQPGQTPDNQQGERNEGDDDMGGQFHGPGNQRVQNARAALETHF